MLKLIIFNNYKILRAIINYRIEKKKGNTEIIGGKDIRFAFSVKLIFTLDRQHQYGRVTKTVEQILASVRFVDKLSIVSFCGARRLEACVLVAFTCEIPDATISSKHKSAMLPTELHQGLKREDNRR